MVILEINYICQTRQKVHTPGERLKNYIILLFKVVFSFRRAFDVELLYIAQKLKITLAEVAVNWTEIEG